MIKEQLEINRSTSIHFNDYITNKIQFDNLFVLTHLGQLKQMEALILSRDLKNNCLLVLYTKKNLIVPKAVHDQYTENFGIAVFLEIPFGINKVDFLKLVNLKNKYVLMLDACRPKEIFLNSFEGHYAILASISKSKNIKTNLVEEGTATYKFNLNKMIASPSKYEIDFEFFRSKFMKTVGQTQIFKKIVKIHKYNKDLANQSRIFAREVLKDEKLQKSLINLLGDRYLKSSLTPFKDFDKAYVSFPSLIKESFGIKDVDYFLVHEVMQDDSIRTAQDIINKYKITQNDIIFVSQRYHLNPDQYAKTIVSILTRIRKDDQTVFIKLHPKENKKIYDSFKYLEFASNKKFVVIEESQFLIESVIKLSKVNLLIGLTSTTLIYGPLVSSETRALSIASECISMLPNNTHNAKGIENIKQHLEIIKIFDNIEFR